MSATIYYEVVDLDELIPWIFRHADIAEENHMDNWSEGDREFSEFFNDLFTYCIELNAQKRGRGCESGDAVLKGSLKAVDEVNLPKESWKVFKREYFKHFISSQGMMLRMLLETVYSVIKGAEDPLIQ